MSDRVTAHRERFLKLQTELRQFSENAKPEQYEQALHQFLAEFEQIRLDAERQILKLYKELGFCEGTQNACNTVANTLVSTLRRYREEQTHHVTTPHNTTYTATETTPQPPKDTDVLKTICICGCLDKTDIAECDCRCHTQGNCNDASCTWCTQQKKSKKDLRRKKKAPKKKATTKKATTKKPAPKKKADNKTPKKK